MSAGSPRSARPARKARAVQPSNGTCASSARIAASRSAFRSGAAIIGPLHRLRARQLLGEAEAGEIAHPHRIEDAVQVVVLVLHDAGVEALRRCLYLPPLAIHPGIADAGRARDGAAQARDGEAAFPAQLAVLARGARAPG